MLVGAWWPAVAPFLHSGWGKGTVRSKSVTVQHHHTPPSRHAHPAHEHRDSPPDCRPVQASGCAAWWIHPWCQQGRTSTFCARA